MPCDPSAAMQIEHEMFMCSKMYEWEYTRPGYVQLED